MSFDAWNQQVKNSLKKAEVLSDAFTKDQLKQGAGIQAVSYTHLSYSIRKSILLLILAINTL